MPQFAPSESKTARVPITVKPSGLSCSAELYLVSNGTKAATSGIKTFTSTGAKQNVRLPITMPSEEGTYHVYIDVYAGGYLVAAYQAIEDVVIAPPSPPVGDFVYSDQQCGIRPFATAPAWMQPTYSVRITNQGAMAGTRIITFYYRSIWTDTEGSAGDLQRSWEQTLEPGESIVVTGDTLWPRGDPIWMGEPMSGIPAFMGYPVRAWMHVEDDAGGFTEECDVYNP